MMYKTAIGIAITFGLCLLVGCQAIKEEKEPAKEDIQPERQVIVAKETVNDGKHESLSVQKERGKGLYLKNCSHCHGDDATGHPMPGHAFPPIPGPLLSLSDKYSQDEVKDIVTNGISYTPMYAFGDSLSEEDITDIVDYLWTLEGSPIHSDST